MSSTKQIQTTTQPVTFPDIPFARGEITAQSISRLPDNSDPPTIVVAGATGVDMTIRQAPNWMGNIGRDTHTADSLSVLNAPFEMGLGGNGAAAAYVIGKLGLPVKLNTSIGEDPAGQLVYNWLAQAGVDNVASKTAESTMVAMTAVDRQGKRLGCLQHPGSPIDWKKSVQDRDATCLLLVVHAQATIEDIHAVRDTLRSFRQTGRFTAFDSGIGWLRKADPNQIHELWSQVNIVTGTLDELATWTREQSPRAIAQAVLVPNQA